MLVKLTHIRWPSLRETHVAYGHDFKTESQIPPPGPYRPVPRSPVTSRALPDV